MENNNNSRVVVGPVRLSYCHLFEPHAIDPNAAAKYSCSILIPKTDTALVGTIKKALTAAIPADAPKTSEGKLDKQRFRLCLRDGDAERNDAPEYKGMYFINASSNHKPGVVKKVNRNGQVVTENCDQDEVYSGCWAYVAINFFAYAKSANKGVSCGLNSVMKYRDDTPFGATDSAHADFADIDVLTEGVQAAPETEDDLLG